MAFGSCELESFIGMIECCTRGPTFEFHTCSIYYVCNGKNVLQEGSYVKKGSTLQVNANPAAPAYL